MGLAAFICTNEETLILDWEDFARSLAPPGNSLSETDLRDSVGELMRAIAHDMDATHTPALRNKRSRGMQPERAPAITLFAHEHAARRQTQGFTLEQLVAEYRAMRSDILRRWIDADGAGPQGVDEVMAFNEAIDHALRESVCWYEGRVEHARKLFLGVLGHDLRTPLGAILASTTLLLRDETLGSESTKAAVRVFNSGKRLRRMIEDLLDFTTTRLGTRLPIDVADVDLDVVFAETVEELRAFHVTRDFRYQGSGDLRGRWDAERLRQMLSNIAGNAAQHGYADKPVVVNARGEADAVVVDIHNEGAPIAPESVHTIFEPLMRGIVAEAERRNHAGSIGLGLYIAREIATAHGGDIEVESTEEAGTTFRVTLPRRGSVLQGNGRK